MARESQKSAYATSTRRQKSVGGLSALNLTHSAESTDEPLRYAVLAYKDDVRKFMAAFGITTPEALRQVDHRSVMLWEQRMREGERLEASTIRRRLAALSSLFNYLVKFGVVDSNPVKDVA